MIPSREFIERVAAQTGYQASSLEKVIILGDLTEESSINVSKTAEGLYE